MFKNEKLVNDKKQIEFRLECFYQLLNKKMKSEKKISGFPFRTPWPFANKRLWKKIPLPVQNRHNTQIPAHSNLLLRQNWYFRNT